STPHPVTPSSTPTRTPSKTTTQAGIFAQVNNTKLVTAKSTCAKPVSPEVLIGVINAAASTPTTAAFAPATAACTQRLFCTIFQNGSTAPNNSKPGKNTAISAIPAVNQAWGPVPISNPKNAAKVNSGPGTAWAAP